MSRRLLLGCSDPEVVGRVRSVAGELGDELTRVTTSSAETIEATATLSPDVLIVADSLGPVPVLDLIRQVSQQNPLTGVLLLSSVADPEMFRVAMEAGARSIAPMGFTIDDLGQRIESAATWARILRAHVTDHAGRGRSTGHVITMAGSKGGVGTTTLAVHVALDAARAGQRACLIDLDLQSGDVAALLDVTHRRDIVDLVAVAGEVSGQSLDDALYRHSSGLHVMLAPREGERGEEVTERVARAVLGAVKSRFDVVVVDVGSVLTPAGAAAVEMADRLALVVTPDVLSARGARRTTQLWERLQLRREGDVEAVLNRVSRHVEVQPDLAARLLKLAVLEVRVPAAFRALEAATNTGDPTRVVDREMRRALARLSDALGARTGAAAQAGASGTADAGAKPNQATPAPAGVTVPAGPGPVGARGPAAAVPGTPAHGTTTPVPTGAGAHSVSAAVAADSPLAPTSTRTTRWRGQRAQRDRGRRDRGQTSVEFLGMFTLLAIFCLALLQGVFIGYGHVLSGHSASRAARVAVSPRATYQDIRAAAVDALPSAWQGDVIVTVDGRQGFGPGDDPRLNDPDAQITVTVHTPVIVPLLGTLLGSGVDATSTAQMHFEGGAA